MRCYGIDIGCDSAVVYGDTVTLLPDANTFVNRLYQNCLERTPDSGGYASWRTVLTNHTASARTVAHGFFFSQEFQNLNLGDADYVKRLYKTMLGREADTSGFNNWFNALQNGSTRLSVFNGFANSTEFTNLCTSMGISAN